MTDSTGGAGEPEASDSLKAFGAVVKAFRKRAGLTREEFAPQVRHGICRGNRGWRAGSGGGRGSRRRR